MKYFSKVLIVLLIAICLIFGFSFVYRDNRVSQSLESTTIHSEVNTSAKKKEDKRVILAENKEANCQIYAYRSDVIVAVNGVEATIEGVAWSVKRETPEIYYKDYDGDGKKDIVTKMVSYAAKAESNDKYVYALRLLRVVQNDEGKDVLKMSYALNDAWKSPFERAIRSELSQLKSNPKFIQFVMDDADEPFVYDEKTGISKNKYVYFAAAEKIPNSQKYRTFVRWNKGDGIYHIDKDGNITVDIQVIAFYDELSVPRYIGYIHTGISIVNDWFTVTPRTISFIPNPEYTVSDPRVVAEKDWSYTLRNNSSVIGSEDKIIKWIETDLKLDMSLNEKTVSFDTFQSNIKYIDSIEFSQDKVRLISKESISVFSAYAETRNYSVIIKNKDGVEVDISDTCSVEKSGLQDILTINLDRRYSKEELSELRINYGV